MASKNTIGRVPHHHVRVCSSCEWRELLLLFSSHSGFCGSREQFIIFKQLHQVDNDRTREWKKLIFSHRQCLHDMGGDWKSVMYHCNTLRSVQVNGGCIDFNLEIDNCMCCCFNYIHLLHLLLSFILHSFFSFSIALSSCGDNGIINSAMENLNT